MIHRTACVLASVLLLGAASMQAGDLTLLPQTIELRGRDSQSPLLLQTARGEDSGGQVREGVEFRSSDPGVAEVVDGVVVPRGNGQATITAVVAGESAESRVTVMDFDAETVWDFRNDVLPVLAKAGCNMGACHGALAGKGGFRLSLRGYDPLADHVAITQQDRGRRIELADPGRSLFLAKPTGALAHKGGVRFEVDSREYRILSEWIAAGASAPTEDDARVERLEILPGLSVQNVGDVQQMLVRAWFSDGEVRDVTPWVKWASANEAVVRIDDDGLATIIGPGEGAVTAWYSQQIAIARVTAPYPESPQLAYDPPRNFIDEHVDRQLARLNLPASPRCDDATFLRRACLDTIGTLPTIDETRAFLADENPDKRDRLIDELLQRPEYIDYWTYKWSDVLMINGTLLRPPAVKSYYQWVRQQVERNTRWDEFVRQILVATGSSLENGATNFYALHQSPEDMTENACQAFLGLSIGCAKCHNHPLEKWSNDQYYAMANLFSRVKAKGWGGEPRNGDGLRTVYVSAHGELMQPRTGKPQPPTPLDGEPLAFDDPDDRRRKLADWLTSRDNPYFARAIANRVWGNFFSVGLVMPLDDLRVSNPASNEELLQAISQHVVEHDFDLKPLMRAILQSNAYQRSSDPLPGNATEQRFYSRYYPRRLMAEVLLDAVSQVTSVPTKFDQIAFPGADKQATDFYPLGTRALQLYDSAVESYFLQTFGRNQRRITCECERSEEPSMVQVLHISNGDTLNEKLKAAGNRIAALLDQGAGNDELIDEAYLAGLSRLPSAEERQRLAEALDEAGSEDRRAAVEDLFWAVLSSREFLFNH
ncbi:MAG: DUF1553 domain-containing protein [Planctomyces sp.]|nr:DUF1553 domain-containing protein [Planctomyces sp.]